MTDIPRVMQYVVLVLLGAVAIVGCSQPVTTTSGNKESQSNSSKGPQPGASNRSNSPGSQQSAPSMSLEDAALNGNVDVVREHIEAGSNLNTQNPVTGSTPLNSATTFGQTEAAIMLIEAGADLEATTGDGNTVLQTAAFFCREEIVVALLDKGADLEAANYAGFTALQAVEAPFEQTKPIYDGIQQVLGPLGLELDYERIKDTRPKIAQLLREASEE